MVTRPLADDPASAIHARGLHKRYGAHAALDGFDLTVRPGTVHGLLGPNGAGKTTAVRVLTTLVRMDRGEATVCGCDLRTEGVSLRSRISLTGQYAAVDESLSGWQNLVMFGRLLKLGRAGARRRAGELLDQFGLREVADRSAGHYSGGLRRRLDLAASVIRIPDVLFLDEPTTGLDPASRNQVWRGVRGLLRHGTTVLLTTQYLEEADQLADRISVMARGRVIAEGTPDELKAITGGDQLEITLRDEGDLQRAAELLTRATGRAAAADPDTRRVSAPAADRVAALTDAAVALRQAGISVTDLGVRRPTLDEAFLRLTSDFSVSGAPSAAPARGRSEGSLTGSVRRPRPATAPALAGRTEEDSR